MPINSFSPDSGSFISLSEANTMISNWESLQSSLNIAISQANPLSHGYGTNKIETILNQSGCVGIRIYNGYSNNERKLVIVGIDSSGNDMDSGNILDVGVICPPNCPASSIND